MSPLTIESLPDPGAPQAVFSFAMSFNGDEYDGAHSASMKAAKERKRATIVDVRNELFAFARASRHLRNGGYWADYRKLLPLLRTLILSSAGVRYRPETDVPDQPDKVK